MDSNKWNAVLTTQRTIITEQREKKNTTLNLFCHYNIDVTRNVTQLETTKCKHFETQKVKYYVKNQKNYATNQDDMIEQGCLKVEERMSAAYLN